MENFETKTIANLEEEYDTSHINGLTEEKAQLRLKLNGLNKLIEKKKKPLILVFLSQLNDPMIYILIIASIISFVIALVEKTNDFADVFIILCVVLLNGTIGTIQEYKAEKSLDALKKMSCPMTLVKRDGIVREIKAEELVVGDLVILEEGRIIPADIRLTSSYNIKTDESSLTGESLPVEKNHDIVFSDATLIGDRKNVVFMSTPIVFGHGEGIVCSVGMHTEIGNIAGMLNENDNSQTPLQIKLAKLSKALGFITIGIVVVLFLFGLISAIIKDKNNLNIMELLLTAISLAVAAVPEGLPAVVTIVLALGVQRMVKVNTIVRKLPSVETLGSVNVVCSDKTGTLTQNKMTVVEAYSDSTDYSKNDLLDEKLELLAKGMSLCTNASIDDGLYGDPTEIALVEFANKLGYKKKDLESNYTRKDELPFDSVRKMMSTMNLYEGKNTIFTKGAIDQILKKTKYILKNGKAQEITLEDKNNIMATSKAMSDKALRVLALAIHTNDIIDEENLVFVGMVGMVDPPREEAKPAVEIFKSSYIRTIMITGDHLDTAYAIAKELKIASSRDECIAGDDLNKLSFEELREVVKTKCVFSRVSPENKVEIVKALRSHGLIVAMTGDGVNDAPSLKQADIGIAMGITGTDVAKGASDMILTDDNFASIEKAVEEGRGIYANIKKTVFFLLSSNFGEVICMALATFMLMPLPLLPTHILWVNLITDSLPAIALGADSKDKNVMKEKPRDKNESLLANGGYKITIGYGVLIALITLIAFIFFPIKDMIDNNISFSIKNLINDLNNNADLLREARTCAFTVLAMSQLFHMVGMSNVNKSFINVFKNKNYLMLIAFILGFILQILVTEVPFLTNLFNTTQLGIVEWLCLLLISLTPLIVHEIIVFIKYIKNKKKVEI